MKRVVMLLVAAAVVAIAFLFATRAHQENSATSVLGMLPRETVALAVIPSVESFREQWRHTDLYAIWQEPAVQEFLKKPRRHLPATAAAVGGTLNDLEQVHAKDVFFALVQTPEADEPRVVAGFRFRNNRDDVETVTRRWREQILGETRDRASRSLDYVKHPITVETYGTRDVFSTITSEWFFAADDLNAVKKLLDCVDGRAADPAVFLTADETFVAAFTQMPKAYAALFYGRPERLGGKLPALKDVRSVCSAVSFERGLIRDKTFVAMPKKIDGTVSPASLALGTPDTFLFFETLADIGTAATDSTASARWLQPLNDLLARNGITAADWNAAFAPELGVIGDWTPGARVPSFVATSPVKDIARAQEISRAFERSATTAGLTFRAKDGVSYFSAPSFSRLVSLSPTLAISDRLLAFAFDDASVESTMQRAQSAGTGMAAIASFQQAQNALPPAQQSFGFFDPGLLYTRLDSALRPMLLMSAAFVPGINDVVDLAKLPDANLIVKHLSPLATSQHYVDGGYLSESVGPMTFNSVLVALVSLSQIAPRLLPTQPQTAIPSGWSGQGLMVPSSSPTPSPAGTP